MSSLLATGGAWFHTRTRRVESGGSYISAAYWARYWSPRLRRRSTSWCISEFGTGMIAIQLLGYIALNWLPLLFK